MTVKRKFQRRFPNSRVAVRSWKGKTKVVVGHGISRPEQNVDGANLVESFDQGGSRISVYELPYFDVEVLKEELHRKFPGSEVRVEDNGGKVDVTVVEISGLSKSARNKIRNAAGEPGLDVNLMGRVDFNDEDAGFEIAKATVVPKAPLTETTASELENVVAGVFENCQVNVAFSEMVYISIQNYDDEGLFEEDLEELCSAIGCRPLEVQHQLKYPVDWEDPSLGYQRLEVQMPKSRVRL